MVVHLPKTAFGKCRFIKLMSSLPRRKTYQAVSDGVVVVVDSSPQKEDSDKIGPLQYFPPNGTFNLMYYPYYGKKAQVRPALQPEWRLR